MGFLKHNKQALPSPSPTPLQPPPQPFPNPSPALPRPISKPPIQSPPPQLNYKNPVWKNPINILFEVPEGRHPRGTTLREALRGICLSEGSWGPLRGSLRGFCGSLFRGPRDFPSVVTLLRLHCLNWHQSIQFRTIVKQPPRRKRKQKWPRTAENLALKFVQISLSKGYFGQFKGYILYLGNVGGLFWLSRVEVATGALQSF